MIGFANSAGTGTTIHWWASAASKFLGIYFSSAGSTTPSSIQGNTIAGINLSGVVGGTSTSAAFVGISIASGVANIGNVTGNTIGSLTTAGSISVASNNGSTMEVYGVYYFPSAVANVSNNNVGGYHGTNSSTGSLILMFYGTTVEYLVNSRSTTIANNTVGSAARADQRSAPEHGSGWRLLGTLLPDPAPTIVTRQHHPQPDAEQRPTSAPVRRPGCLIGLWSDNSSATVGNNGKLRTRSISEQQQRPRRLSG